MSARSASPPTARYWGWGTNDGNSLDLPTTTTNIGAPIELTAIEPYASVVVGAYKRAG